MASRAAPHVLMAPIHGAGHSTPFLIFAERLAAEGVTVTVVSSDNHIAELLRDRHSSSQEAPIRFLALRDGSDHLTHHQVFGERTTQAGRDKTIRLLVELIADITSPNAQRLRGVPPQPLPVCILHDMMSCWAQEAAEKFGIQKHMLYVSPMACLAIGLQAERLEREGRVPVTPDTQASAITDIPGMPPLRPADLPTMYLFAHMFEWYKYHENRNAKADVILSNSFYDLEKQVIDGVRKQVIGAPGVQTECLLDVGPLLPESYIADDAVADSLNQHAVEEKDSCIRWLSTQKPASVLYVCFGSHTTLEAPQLMEIALGLEASGQPFLWILRPPKAAPVSEVDSGASTPSMTEYLPPGFEERVKGRGMCYSGWVSQGRILKHVATGGFLSHCGWNSVLESVCAGVPMLAWPFWADQNVNSRFLVDSAKLALELEREPLDPERDIVGNRSIERRVRKEEIERQSRRLMQEEEGRIVRQNMRNMKLNAQRAVASGGSSTRNFETYVGLLFAKAAAADGKLGIPGGPQLNTTTATTI